jgi:hypothetical protein
MAALTIIKKMPAAGLDPRMETVDLDNPIVPYRFGPDSERDVVA